MPTEANHHDPTTITEIPPRGTRPGARSRALVAGAAVLALALGGAALAFGGGTDGDRTSTAAPDRTTTSTTAEADAEATTSTTGIDVEAQPASAPGGTGSGAGSGSGGGATTPAVGLLSLSAPALDLGPATGQATVTLRNDGTATAGWELSSDLPPWLQLAPTSGTLAPGASVELTVTADRGDLSNGLHPVDVALATDAGFAGQAHVAVSVAVEKAEIHAVVGAPAVICALQSPGAGQTVAVIVAAGVHLAQADTVFAKIDAPNADLQKNMAYDEVHDRWTTTYTSTVPGVHHLSAYATGDGAVPGDAGNGAIHVVWCP
jgi:hypothetical protein